MRRIISLIIVLTLSWSLFDDVLFAQKSTTKESPAQESKVIDLTADIVYPVTLNDTVEVMCLVGNFAAQHNGAIITADSAVRYNDKRLECFGNVLINKNTTYAYAESADYNGDLNEINLYAPIIKVVDEEATLYCYNFRFNTLDNIGIYEGGGVMINGDNIMESVTGYYYADFKELIGVGDVELRGDEYEMQSDSIIYNTETESANYYSNTNIWNQKDEYLYADAGDYDKTLDRYSFSLNGYLLTKEQEMWSDSMDYFRASEHIYMRHNIQIDDTTQKSLIFGDYGEYIKTPGDMVLVGRPSIINYDLEQGDSLFMRADTFEIFTLNRFESSESTDIVSATDVAEKTKIATKIPARDSLEMESHDHNHDHDHDHDHDIEQAPNNETVEQVAKPDVKPSLPTPATASADTTARRIGTPPAPLDKVSSKDEEQNSEDNSIDTLAVDSLERDSLAVDSVARVADTLNYWQRLKRDYLEKRKAKAAVKAKEQAARKVVLDSIGRARQEIINKKLDAEKVREARRIAERKAKASERKLRKMRRDFERGKITAADTAAMVNDFLVDTAALIEELAPQSSMSQALAPDSLLVDSLQMDSLAVDSIAIDTIAVDSTYRLTKGYRNVKIYRSDFQSVADSLVTSSIDSILRLYIEPVLWHDSNQVTSEMMDIYTANNQITKAIFTEGNPIMASELEPELYYNQIAGKVITTLFAEGNAYRTDADGNAQTIYFMQDDDTQEVNGMMVMEAGAATFYIEDQQVVGITYRGEPNYTLYPMNLIPADQEFALKGFTWQQDRRPEQAEVFDRTIRPTIREEKSALPKPLFPIHEQLNVLRKDLEESGEWVDRVDVVSPQAEAWMESLGYKTGQPRQQ